MADVTTDGWLVERGIAEDRALLFRNGEPVSCRVHWTGELYAGAVVPAKLVSRRANSSRGLAVTKTNDEILLDRLPKDVTEGRTVAVEITRAPVAEHGRLKCAQGRAVDDSDGAEPLAFARPVRRFPAGAWEDVWTSASEARIDFAGGALLISVTPAMVLIDIDGELAPPALSLAAVPQIARAIELFSIGGSVGIDFPTLERKADRKAVDAALASALAQRSHERTAMNGFGFVQIVSRLEGPSLLHRLTFSRLDASARLALRRAEMVEGPGVTLLRVNPALEERFEPEWLEELSRRTGRPTRIEAVPGLAIKAASAQIVPHDE